MNDNAPDLVSQPQRPNVERVTYTAPYEKDNLINTFGDADGLRVEFIRTKDGDATNVYLMKGKVVHAILNPEEVATALLNFFIWNSTREEG